MFTISPVSTSGYEEIDDQQYTLDTLEEARSFAHDLIRQSGAWNVFVQGDGRNECHTGGKCEACSAEDSKVL